MKDLVMKSVVLYGLVATLIVLDVFLISNWFDYKQKREKFIQTHSDIASARPINLKTLQYGDIIQLFEIYDLSGMKISPESIKGKITIFQFFRPEKQYHKDVLAYTDILAKQYKGQLLFVAIGQGKLGWLIRKGFHLKHTWIVEDQDFSLERLFKTDSSLGATIIVDGDGRVRFASPNLVPNDLLRQLVTKFARSS